MLGFKVCPHGRHPDLDLWDHRINLGVEPITVQGHLSHSAERERQAGQRNKTKQTKNKPNLGFLCTHWNMVKLAVVMLTFVVCGPQRDTLGSMDLLQLVGTLMSVVHVTPKGHIDVRGLCCHLGPC